jgi:glycosyltransferase involved in cell wall biosynthesis
MLDNNNKDIVLSIIIPTYNSQKFIKNCLYEIKKIRSYKIELIIVDDCSEDNTVLLLNKFLLFNKIIVIIKKKNVGVGTCRNLGLKIAKGKYVWFVDSDDQIITSQLNLIINKIQTLNDVDFFIGNYKIYNNHNEASKFLNNFYSKKDKLTPDEFLKKLNYDQLLQFRGNCWRYIIKRDFLKKNGIVFSKRRLFEDITFVAEIFFKANYISILNKYIYLYIKRPLSLSSHFDYSNKNLLEAVAASMECLKMYFKNSPNKIGIRKLLIHSSNKLIGIIIPYLSKNLKIYFLKKFKKIFFQLFILINKNKNKINFSDKNLLICKLANYRNNFISSYKDNISFSLLKLLKKIKNFQNIFIYCNSTQGRILASLLLEKKIHIRGVLDSDEIISKKKTNKDLNVYFASDKFLEKIRNDKAYIIITARTYVVEKEIINRLISLGWLRSRIFFFRFSF